MGSVLTRLMQNQNSGNDSSGDGLERTHSGGHEAPQPSSTPVEESENAGHTHDAPVPEVVPVSDGVAASVPNEIIPPLAELVPTQVVGAQPKSLARPAGAVAADGGNDAGAATPAADGSDIENVTGADVDGSCPTRHGNGHVMCAICQDGLGHEDVEALICGHVYHRHCLSSWRRAASISDLTQCPCFCHRSALMNPRRAVRTPFNYNEPRFRAVDGPPDLVEEPSPAASEEQFL